MVFMVKLKQCLSLTGAGTRCRSFASDEDGLCYQHKGKKVIEVEN